MSFDNMADAIRDDGQPLEEDWPYLSTLGASDQWKPPSSGNLFYRETKTIPAEAKSICENLSVGRPVILTMAISEAFFYLSRSAVLGASREPTVNRHAVLATGHGKMNKALCILIRNSWGDSWADSGYAWIHEDYLTPRLMHAGVML